MNVRNRCFVLVDKLLEISFSEFSEMEVQNEESIHLDPL